jgi:two-component system response regulator PilR (NtrC family)
MSIRSIAPPELRILIVDDEPALREMLEIMLGREGYRVVSAAGFEVAIEAISQAPQPFPVILTDLVMPDGSGLDVLAAAKQRSASTEVILFTAHNTVENAIAAMSAGAFNFVTKPFETSALLAMVRKALEKHALLEENFRLKAQVQKTAAATSELVGKSRAMCAVIDMIGRVAPMRTTVLITGESGTGKECVARAIHQRSDRAHKPCLVVNCGALPEALMESELFGHEKGAFTGATGKHIGIFRDAEGGTVMLDEVGELSLPLQVKLLRVLQERKVKPVGSSQEVPIDVRVLAATNRNVEEEVAAGRFRQDLYYRLNVIRVELPPLRDRSQDIAALTERFVDRFAKEMGKDVRGLTPDALRALERYNFPGNVRELENVIERAVALAGSRAIGLGDMPREVSGMSSGAGPNLVTLPAEGCNLDEVIGEIERRLMLEALERTGGVRKTAAQLLGITFRSLRYRLAKHDLDSGDGPDSGLESEEGARG